MIVHRDIEQGSPEWLALRVGRLTASNFSRLITPTKLQPSAQADELMDELLAEWVEGQPLDDEWAGNYWTDRGKALESQARDYFELATEIHVQSVGFVERDAHIGCSPDGVELDDDGLVVQGMELKCPSPKVHLAYRRKAREESWSEPKYVLQVQASIWICKVERWWLQSYCPRYPAVLRGFDRDKRYMDAFDEIVPAFIERLEREKEMLLNEGVVPAEPGMIPAEEYQT